MSSDSGCGVGVGVEVGRGRVGNGRGEIGVEVGAGCRRLQPVTVKSSKMNNEQWLTETRFFGKNPVSTKEIILDRIAPPSQFPNFPISQL